jgi:hypothetical protein
VGVPSPNSGGIPIGRPAPLPYLFLRIGLFAVIRLDTLLVSSDASRRVENAIVSRMIATCSGSSVPAWLDSDAVSAEVIAL